MHLYCRVKSTLTILTVLFSGGHPFDYTDEFDLSGYSYGQPRGSQYSDDVEAAIKERILKCSPKYERYPWNGLPDGMILRELSMPSLPTTNIAMDLVRSLLVSDCEKRMTVDGALQSRWIMLDLVALETAYHNRVIANLSEDEKF